VRELNSLKEKSLYLAKGELNGALTQSYRSSSQILRGTGFNYDFADEEGPARDLRTGKPIGQSDKSANPPLIKVNDLLLTTGMDGVFPPHLQVAVVSKIIPLKEGDYTYEIEAKPTAGDLNQLSLVFVIPPIGYDPEDLPPL
jgi:hypothetical protein